MRHTPSFFIFSGQFIIQPSEIRRGIRRSQCRIFRIVICKRTLCRQISICPKTRHPIIICLRNTRIFPFFYTAIHGSSHFQTRSNLRVYVHLNIGTFKSTIIYNHRVLAHVTDRNIIVRLIRTTGDIGIQIILRIGFPDEVIPVKRHISFFFSRQPFLIVFLTICIVGLSLNRFRLDIIGDIGRRIRRFRESRRILPTVVCVQRNRILSVPFTFFRIDNNNTICRTHTVNSGRSIFQYRNALDIIEVDIIELACIRLHTVDHIQRITHVTDLDTGRSPRTAIRLARVQTGDLTDQCTRSRGGNRTADVFRTDGRDGTRQRRLFLRQTETGHHHFFQRLRIFTQSYIQSRFSFDRNRLRDITDIRNFQHGIRSHSQGKSTIHICNDTVGRPFFNDIGSRYRFTQIVDYDPFYYMCL